MARLIADAGLLVAADRNDRGSWALKKLVASDGLELVVPAAVLAQAWRGPGSVNLARFMKGLPVEALDEQLARATGELLAVSKSADVVDASLVAGAREGDRIVTGDVKDIGALVELRGVGVEISPI